MASETNFDPRGIRDTELWGGTELHGDGSPVLHHNSEGSGHGREQTARHIRVSKPVHRVLLLFQSYGSSPYSEDQGRRRCLEWAWKLYADPSYCR